MADAGIPVLWICGPPGVGKSTVSWQLYTELADSGVPVAFADTDQLSMCYPAPAGDPGRQHVRALNAGAVVRNFRSAGARCVIVSGLLGPSGLATGLLPDARVTLCRLCASPGEVERRFLARHGHRGDLDELLRAVRDEIRAARAEAGQSRVTASAASPPSSSPAPPARPYRRPRHLTSRTSAAWPSIPPVSRRMSRPA